MRFDGVDLMDKGKRDGTIKEKLILAGIEEIRENGIRNFSARRVAARCGVSCAAPYKHFEDQHHLIRCIIEHLKEEWYGRQRTIEEKYRGNTRKQLMEISMEYVRFLLDYPYFRSTIMMRDAEEQDENVRAKSELSECTKRLISKYCAEAGLSAEDELRKTFIVRSLIYGAALMLDNGELPKNDDSMRLVAQAMEREFDLP